MDDEVNIEGRESTGAVTWEKSIEDLILSVGAVGATSRAHGS